MVGRHGGGRSGSGDGPTLAPYTSMTMRTRSTTASSNDGDDEEGGGGF